MKILYDFFPVLLFFLAYKFYDIYIATAVAMVAAFLQTIGYWWKYRKFEIMHLVTLGMILVLGSITLIFHNPVFIKWKPTLVNWLFSAVFLGSHWFSDKTIIERMLSTQVTLPNSIWIRLNLAWVVFFLLSGVINLYVAYNFSEAAWVNFKLFGMMGLTITFVLLQTVYLSRYIKED